MFSGTSQLTVVVFVCDSDTDIHRDKRRWSRRRQTQAWHSCRLSLQVFTCRHSLPRIPCVHHEIGGMFYGPIINRLLPSNAWFVTVSSSVL